MTTGDLMSIDGNLKLTHYHVMFLGRKLKMKKQSQFLFRINEIEKLAFSEAHWQA
jgi:hypothetical protein